MIVIDLAKTDYDETCYNGCGIGFLDVRNGRIADAGYGWPGSCDYPDTCTCPAGNPPPVQFEDGTVRIFGSYNHWAFITYD